MCITEYNEARTMELFRMEGRNEGLEEGLEKGLEKGRDETSVSAIRNLMTKLHLTAEKAMEILEIPEENHRKYSLMLKEAETAKPCDEES